MWIGIAALFAFLTGKQIYDLIKLQIRTEKKKKEEWLIFGVLVLVLLFLIAGGKSLEGKIAGSLGLTFLFLYWKREGIAKKGIYAFGKGRACYDWEEIRKAEIVRRENLKVTFYHEKKGAFLVQQYSGKDYEKICSRLKEQKITAVTKGNIL